MNQPQNSRLKLGVNTLLWTAHFDTAHLELFPAIAAHGFSAVEVARFDFTGFPAQAIRSAAAAHNLDVLLCSAFTGDLSLASDDASVRARSLAHLRAALAAAQAVGSSLVVGPFCTPVGGLPGRRRTPDEWQRVVDGLSEIAPEFAQAGVRLALEPLNRFETYFLNTTEDAVRLCQAIHSPAIGILFDTFHANIEEKDIPTALRLAGPHLFHVHTCENDRGAPGSGHIPWPAVLAELQALSYSGHCVIESFGFNIKEIAAAACIWRDLAPTPDDIAWRGAAYLKSLA